MNDVKPVKCEKHECKLTLVNISYIFDTFRLSGSQNKKQSQKFKNQRTSRNENLLIDTFLEKVKVDFLTIFVIEFWAFIKLKGNFSIFGTPGLQSRKKWSIFYRIDFEKKLSFEY